MLLQLMQPELALLKPSLKSFEQSKKNGEQSKKDGSSSFERKFYVGRRLQVISQSRFQLQSFTGNVFKPRLFISISLFPLQIFLRFPMS